MEKINFKKKLNLEVIQVGIHISPEVIER